MTLAAVGVVTGLCGAFALTRVIAGMLFGVRATDSVTFVGVSLMLLCIAVIASYIPALRATRIDPVIALRYE
jgi:ABC-type antimicrobial peptide transport system permease subunit